MRQSSNAIAMYNQLPAATRRKLDVRDMEAITGSVLVKERVYMALQVQAREAAEARRYKAKHGYCTGRLTCLTYVGKTRSVCGPCAAERAEYSQEAALRLKGGAERRTRQSEYGSMRAEDRRRDREGL